MRPFPQHGNNLQELWEQYRQRMISLAGIALFFFGNKRDGDKLVNANGVRRECEIALGKLFTNRFCLCHSDA